MRRIRQPAGTRPTLRTPEAAATNSGVTVVNARRASAGQDRRFASKELSTHLSAADADHMDEPRDIFDVLGNSVAHEVNLEPTLNLAPYAGKWVTPDGKSVIELRPDGSFTLQDDGLAGSGAWRVQADRLILDGHFNIAMNTTAMGVQESPSALRTMMENGPPLIEVVDGSLVLRTDEHRASFAIWSRAKRMQRVLRLA